MRGPSLSFISIWLSVLRPQCGGNNNTRTNATVNYEEAPDEGAEDNDPLQDDEDREEEDEEEEEEESRLSAYSNTSSPPPISGSTIPSGNFVSYTSFHFTW